jgi:hypothetical protein
MKFSVLMKLLILACALFLGGCGAAIAIGMGVAADVHMQQIDPKALLEDGYVSYAVTPDGKPVPNFYLFVRKPPKEPNNAYGFCMMRANSPYGFRWSLKIVKDGDVLWTYDSISKGKRNAELRRFYDCTTSPPMPEGDLQYLVAVSWL